MVLIVIPARYASTRFPGKPLVKIGQHTMIERVYRQVSAAACADRVVVATDDLRILDHVQAFGGNAMMTDAHHPSGTDRCAEVATAFPDADWILNVQGDEPFIQPQQIDLLYDTLRYSDGGIATLAKKLDQDDQLFNPNTVKVVFNQSGNALYFSRNPIPFLRGVEKEAWLAQQMHYKHIGLYGFHRSKLLQLAQLSPTALEMAESLEQLRWLDHGYQIQVGITDLETIGIDTPEDLERV